MEYEETCQPMSLHFTAKNVPAAVKFYTDVLGFALKTAWPSEGDPMWASLELEGQTIMLGAHMEQPSGPATKFLTELNEDWKKAPGGGVLVYLRVDDVDSYYEEVVEKGARPACKPKDEFYGLRNFLIQDLDGYRLAFYAPLQMTSCQSCSMPLTDAKEGQMYCEHCTDEDGQLRPFEAILEGTIRGYFMGMQKMERAAAEVAAKEHLAKMPAWVHLK